MSSRARRSAVPTALGALALVPLGACAVPGDAAAARLRPGLARAEAVALLASDAQVETEAVAGDDVDTLVRLGAPAATVAAYVRQAEATATSHGWLVCRRHGGALGDARDEFFLMFAGDELVAFLRRHHR